MIVPPVSSRREIDRDLSKFFHNHRSAAFRRAIAAFCRYFSVKKPRIEWFEYLDWGKTAGKTWEDGRIHLVHPENWKRGRVYYSERKWIQMIYHEMGHYLFWTDAERKAEAFSRAMVRGLRRGERSGVRNASRAAAARTVLGSGVRRPAARARAPHARTREQRWRARARRAPRA